MDPSWKEEKRPAKTTWRRTVMKELEELGLPRGAAHVPAGMNEHVSE